MEVLDGKDKFCNVESRFVLAQFDFLSKMVGQVSSRAVIQHKVKVVRSLECEVQSQDEWVLA
jgi:hypothetical protein